MPTYKVSPFATPLQAYLFTGAATDEVGQIDITGTTGSVYTIRLDATSSGGVENFLLMWDGTEATTSEAEIVIPVADTKEMVIWVDKGITHSTAITIAVSSAAAGGSAPSGTVNVNLFAS